jgi:hypothetical protein
MFTNKGLTQRTPHPMKKAFKARLISRGPKGAWTFLPIPFSVEQAFGSKAQVPVAGTINGHPFRNSLKPEGDGTHVMMVGKVVQEGARASVGDLVAVVMQVDSAERKAEVPGELKAALRREPAAKRFFEGLSYSRQREYADWVAGAKRPETKAVRVAKSLELLLANKKLS